MTEHLHELKPPRSYLDVVAATLGKMDNEPFTSPEARAKRFTALLSLEGFGVYPTVPAFPARAIR